MQPGATRRHPPLFPPPGRSPASATAPTIGRTARETRRSRLAGPALRSPGKRGPPQVVKEHRRKVGSPAKAWAWAGSLASRLPSPGAARPRPSALALLPQSCLRILRISRILRKYFLLLRFFVPKTATANPQNPQFPHSGISFARPAERCREDSSRSAQWPPPLGIAVMRHAEHATRRFVLVLLRACPELMSKHAAQASRRLRQPVIASLLRGSPPPSPPPCHPEPAEGTIPVLASSLSSRACRGICSSTLLMTVAIQTTSSAASSLPEGRGGPSPPSAAAVASRRPRSAPRPTPAGSLP